MEQLASRSCKCSNTGSFQEEIGQSCIWNGIGFPDLQGAGLEDLQDPFQLYSDSDLGNPHSGKWWPSEEMEFPDLGQHCCEKSCRRLDFLPLKCDACKELFCKDHIIYSRHKCSSAYKKDVQVPVCPLCNTPVPIRKGETPDVAVGTHMDRDCQQDLGQQKQKIFTNKCFKADCRKKEMMRLVCDQCHQNFCLHHRHPLDHQCPGRIWPVSKAGCAAIMRSLQDKNNSPNCQLLQNGCKAKS